MEAASSWRRVFTRSVASLNDANQSDPLEWRIVQRAVTESGSPLIYPVWTLAPLSCADALTATSIDFILSITEDKRWERKEIVLSGSSAGGWCATRTFLALCETACHASDESRRRRARRALARIRGLALFSPVLDLEEHPGLVESAKAVSSASCVKASLSHPLGSHPQL